MKKSHFLLFTLIIQLLIGQLFMTNQIYGQGAWIKKMSLKESPWMSGVTFVLNNKIYLACGRTETNKYSNACWEYDPAFDAWVQKADFPSDYRSGAVGFASNNFGFVGLGWNGKDFFPDFYKYDPTLNIWSALPNSPNQPSVRYGAFSFVLNNKAYVGCGFSGNYHSDVYCLDLTEFTWTLKRNFKYQAHSLASFVSEGQAFLGTGYTSEGTQAKNFYKYNESADEWLEIAAFPGIGRYLAVAFSTSDGGYVGLGVSRGYFSTVYTDIYHYDKQNNSWSFSGYFPTAYCYSNFFATYNSSGYVFGGSNLKQTTDQNYCLDFSTKTWSQKKSIGSFGLNYASGSINVSNAFITNGQFENLEHNLSTWFYDALNNNWSKSDDFIDEGRSMAYSFQMNGMHYVGGGLDQTGFTFNDLWQYNPSTKIWTGKLINTGNRFAAVSFVLGTKAYIGLGINPPIASSTFYEYDPVTNNLREITNFPSDRYAAFSFVINGKAYVGGGISTSSYPSNRNDFYEFDPAANLGSGAWLPRKNLGGGYRYGCVAFSLNGKGYITTGNALNPNDLWEYNPATDNWNIMARFPGENRTSGAVSFSYNKSGYVGLGKLQSGKLMNDLWEYRPDAPSINTQPISQTVAEGNSVIFSVNASNANGYQWYRGGSAISGAINSTLTLYNISLADANNYYVETSNASVTLVSNTATLTVLAKPQIIDQPQAQVIYAGNKLILSVNAVKAESYQWYKNNILIPNETYSTFSIPNIQLTDAGNYNVEATNGAGSIVSNTVSVSVNELLPIKNKDLTYIPCNSGFLNAPALLSLPAAYSSYTWFDDKNGDKIPDAGEAISNNSSCNVSLPGTYSVKITDANNRSGVGSVTVKAVKETGYEGYGWKKLVAPYTIKKVVGIDNKIWGTADFDIYNYDGLSWKLSQTFFNGLLDISLISDKDIWVSSWRGKMHHYDGINWTTSNPFYENITTCVNFLTSDLGIAGDAMGYLRLYDGISWSSISFIEYTGINDVFIVSENNYWVVTSGGIYFFNGNEFSLSYTSVGLRSIQMKDNLNGIAIGWDGKIVICENGNWLTLSDKQYPNLSAVAYEDNIAWIVGEKGTLLKIENGTVMPVLLGTSENLTDVYFQEDGIGYIVGDNQTLYKFSCGSLSITQQPTAKTICAGSGTTFSVTATGDPAPNAYQWQVQNGAVWQNLTNVAPYSNVTSANLSINNAPESLHGNNYRCVVRNGVSKEVVSDMAQLSVNTLQITYQPQASVTVCIGNFNQISVTANSNTTIAYQWEAYNGSSWSNVANSAIYDGAQTASLKISQPTLAYNNYQYRCKLSAGYVCSLTSASSTLIVKDAPKINQQPINTTGCIGGAATFGVLTTDANYYQWRRNGMPIAGANATLSAYTVAPIAAGFSGSYSVDVYGECGVITSSSADLIVQSSFPSIINQPASQSICTDTPVTFSVAATGADSYQWNVNGFAIYEAMDSIYTMPAVAFDDAASYTVDVTNSCGTSTSAAASLTLRELPTFYLQPIGGTYCEASDVVLHSASLHITSYQWYKNDELIEVERLSRLDLNNLSASNEAQYSVLATNECGETWSHSVSIIVLPLPHITHQPESVAGCENLSAQLLVEAPNASSFQWYQNNVPMSGFNDALLQIDSLQLQNNVAYKVEAINSCGTEISNEAFFLVNPIPEKPRIIQKDRMLNASSITSDSYNWYLDNNYLSAYPVQALWAGSSGSFALEVVERNCVSPKSDPIYVDIALSKDNYIVELNPKTFYSSNQHAQNASVVFTHGFFNGGVDCDAVADYFTFEQNIIQGFNDITLNPLTKRACKDPLYYTIRVSGDGGLIDSTTFLIQPDQFEPGIVHTVQIKFPGTDDYIDLELKLNIDNYPANPLIALTGDINQIICEGQELMLTPKNMPPFAHHFTWEYAFNADFSDARTIGYTSTVNPEMQFLCPKPLVDNTPIYFRAKFDMGDAVYIDPAISYTVREWNNFKVEPIVETKKHQYHVSCFDSNDGLVNMNATGGSGMYRFELDAFLPKNDFHITDSFIRIRKDEANINNLYALNYSYRVIDSRSCYIKGSLALTQPDEITYQVEVTHASNCYNDKNGSIKMLQPTGDLYEFEYWSTRDTANQDPTRIENIDPNKLYPGNYQVFIIAKYNVEDGLLCQISTDTIQVLGPDPIVIAGVVRTDEDEKCPGSPVNVQVYAAGGTGTLSYAIENKVAGADSIVLGVLPGKRLLKITDDNACVVSKFVDILDHPKVRLSSADIDVSDNMACNEALASVDVKAAGGYGEYLFSLNSGSFTTNSKFSDLTSGVHLLRITDRLDCVIDTFINIPLDENNVPAYDVRYSAPDICGKAGDINIIADAGYTVTVYVNENFSDAKTLSPSANGYVGYVKPGKHLLSFKGSNCNFSVPLFLSDDNALPLSMAVNKGARCYGMSNGYAMISVPDSSRIQDILWSHDISNKNLMAENLPAGNYTVMVKDIDGCSSFLNFKINQHLPLKVEVISQTNVLCAGDATGMAAVSINGGTGNYFLSLNHYEYSTDENRDVLIRQPIALTHGNNFVDISYLKPLMYILSLSDDSACIAETNLAIAEPHPLTINHADIQIGNRTCSSLPDGTISFMAYGGTIPYSYRLIKEGNVVAETAAAVFNQLQEGNYTIEVKDKNNCVLQHEVELIQSTDLTISARTYKTICKSPTGSARIIVNNGLAPFEYDAGSYKMIADSIINLPAGEHRILVTDANNCSGTAIFNIEYVEGPQIRMDKVKHPSCFGFADGALVYSVSEGWPPYKITLNGSDATPADKIFNLLSHLNLDSGVYTIQAEDQFGCKQTAWPRLIMPEKLSIEKTIVKGPSCPGLNNGKLSLDALGGTTPYYYSVNEGVSIHAVEMEDLAAGNYHVVVKDAMDCEYAENIELRMDAGIIFNIPESVTICKGQHYFLNAYNENASYEWWFNEQLISTEKAIVPDNEGIYTVMAYYNNAGEKMCQRAAVAEVKFSSDALKIDLLVAQEAFVEDTVVAIDISRPVPDELHWYPDVSLSSILAEKSENGVSYYIAQNEGISKITIEAKVGECFKETTREILIRPKSEKENLSSGLFKSIVAGVSPNPNSGRFTLKISLSDAADVQLEMVNTLGLPVYESRLVGKKDYVSEIILENVVSGNYFLRLVSNQGVAVLLINVQN